MHIKNEQIDLAWEYIKECLFNKETQLIYDHKNTDHREFPTAEEIARFLPNPCGYGTGMEDGMIDCVFCAKSKGFVPRSVTPYASKRLSQM